MNTSNDNDHEARALEAASRWVVVLRGGDVSLQDRRALKAWLRQDAAHAAALDLTMNVWEQIGPLNKTPPVQLEAPVRPRRASTNAPAPWTWIRWGALSTGGAALAGLAVALLLLPPPTTQTYVTAVGQMTPIVLGDHSWVWLNTNSRLKVTYTAFRRSLTLERGEAEFKVAHAAWRPFVVTTPAAVVRATGTDFDVLTDADDSRILLVEGTVRVRSSDMDKGAAVSLRAGYTLLAPRIGPFRLTKADTAADLAWRRGELVFYERPIVDVVGEFARYGGVRVRFADETAKRELISGVFRANDFKSFLKDASKIDGIHFYTDNNHTVVIHS